MNVVDDLKQNYLWRNFKLNRVLLSGNPRSMSLETDIAEASQCGLVCLKIECTVFYLNVVHISSFFILVSKLGKNRRFLEVLLPLQIYATLI